MVYRKNGLKVNKTTELEDGRTVKFEGEISGPELDYVLGVGLNTLMYTGLLPVVKKDPNLHIPPQEFEH